MNKTKIEYLDYTWNPIAMKYTPVTEGCKNCWHLRMAHRLAHNPIIDAERRAAYAGGDPVFVEKELGSPFKIHKPARIGVQFMGDLFLSEDYTLNALRVLAVIEHATWHKFVILTKRPQTALAILKRHTQYKIPDNAWLGVSISTNADLWMVDKLLEIPAAVRFVSVEPQLEYIDMSDYLMQTMIDDNLDWIIQGAETGHGKRPFDIRWAKDMQEKCCLDDVPFFFKQDGDGNNTIDGKTYQEYPNETGN